MKSGIYKIVCKHSGRIYIGQAINISIRWKEHIKKLKNGSHPNRILKGNFNKYGQEGLIFSVVCYCPIPELDELECYYIKKYKSDKIGCNFTSGGGSGLMSEENKIIRRLNRKGKKKIIGYSLDGTVVKEWVSIKECAQFLKVNPCDVRRTTKGIQRTCRGLVLRFGKFTPVRDRIGRERDKIGRFLPKAA